MIGICSRGKIAAGIFVLLAFTPTLHRGVCADDGVGESPSETRIRGAIEKSLLLLETASAGTAEHRICFTCHGQALPVLALTEANQRGFDIDEVNLQRQLDHTAAHLRRGHKNYLSGKGQGGRVDTAGYALWTLEAGERRASDVTDAVVEYVLTRNSHGGRWKRSSNRPPSEASDYTTTYLALRALIAFGTEEQQPRISERKEDALKWLLESEPRETEDRVFHLRSLSYASEDNTALRRFADALIAQQRSDGGWAQKSAADSDAYATSTTLVCLARTGSLLPSSDCYQRGIIYLLNTQHGDGSWFVASRSEPFQKYFETGFPHGKEQFISTTATAWSTIALLLTLPKSE